MKKLAVLAIVVAFACTKDHTATSDECDAAGDGVKTFWTTKAASETDDAAKHHAIAMGEGTASRTVRHCKSDAWSQDVVVCFRTASEDTALAACMRKLTADQKQKLQSDLGR